MTGLDLLGAAAPPPPKPTFAGTALAVGAGALGATLFSKHPVLAFLGFSAAASNTYDLARGERTLGDAARRMGRHIVATASSLALPSYPIIGYIAGAIAGDLLLDGRGGGIIEEWSHHVVPKNSDIIDASFVEVAQPQALVKT